MRFLKICVACFAIIGLLAGCADPNKRATVLSSAKGQVEKIADIDVILTSPGMVMDGRVQKSMQLGGWDDGSFAEKFGKQLIVEFAERGVKIHSVKSDWGRPQKIDGPTEAKSSTEARITMYINPTGVRFLMDNYGRVLSGGFALPSKVLLAKNKEVVWEALEEVNMAPIDPTGAKRFSIGILNSMADSGLIAGR